MVNHFLRFEQVIYPLWRRRALPLLKPLTDPFFARHYPVHADRYPPHDLTGVARALYDWRIMADATPAELLTALESVQATITAVDLNAAAPRHDGTPVRIPAQWAQSERALVSWGWMYPALWPMHAQLVEAISQVAIAEVLLPDTLWARAVALYLCERGAANIDNVHLLALPTNDIWIRDYGPIMGVTADGQRVAFNATYDVLPQYPQADDNNMTERWAAHHGIPVQPLDLHTEGGNLWSDGQGTLIMSSQIFYSNRYYTRATLLDYLHTIVDFEKVIITPRLTLEETGHVDLLVKLVDAGTMFISEAASFSTEAVLRKTRRLFERESNARGAPYQVIDLPTPPLYLNWFTYTIRRAYTNALTINGRVLVPVFGIPQDDIALRRYQQHMPDFEIIPIDSRVGINGGGAVHCMTREIPV